MMARRSCFHLSSISVTARRRSSVLVVRCIAAASDSWRRLSRSRRTLVGINSLFFVFIIVLMW